MQRYQIKRTAEQLCAAIDVKYEQVTALAGLSTDLAKGVTAPEYFALWSAAIKSSERNDFALWLTSLNDGVPHNSETAAFALSPNVCIALDRLAIFKPLLCPVRMRVEDTRSGVLMSFHSDSPSHPLPADFQALHLIFVLSLIRFYTGEHVVPLKVGFDGPELAQAEVADFFNCAPLRQPFPTMLITNEDASLPILFSDAEKWAWVEPGLRARLDAMHGGQTMSERVAGVLVETLPVGLAGIDVVSNKLHMSKRSLQRSLSEESLRYQDVLMQTRKDLALGYLRTPEITIHEIAHLLAYREPNSFFRAFQTWTGMTPSNARLNMLG